MDALPQISMGTAVLLIFAICAAYMFIRGLIRTIVNLSILALSIWVGFYTWQQAPTLAIRWTGETSPLITNGFPILALVLSFVILRKILRLFLTPVSTQQEDFEEPEAQQPLFGRLFITFILATILCLIAAAVLHHITSISEIRHHSKSGDIPNTATRIKKSIETLIPSSWMDKLDPLATQPRIELAKWFASQSEIESKEEKTAEQPVPPILENPELISLAEKGRFSTLLRHPLLTEAINDPTVMKILGIK
jgi:hypothetical protein